MMEEISKRVVLKSTHIVAPAQPTYTVTPRIRPLSVFDIIYSHTFVYNIYYFAPSHSHLLLSSSHQFFESLKDSLAKVLVHFPVAAGRWRVGNEDGKLCIVCNDEGALLVEASADARFDEWKFLRDCPLETYLILKDQPCVTDHISNILLKIQVTSFRCGGIAIGIGFDHVCADGWSAIAFMKSWSEVHRGFPISVTPVFDDAGVLKARTPPSVDHHVKDYTFSPLPQTSGLDSHMPAKVETVTFYFSSAAVNALLQEVENGPCSYERPTSFEALAALCWKTMTEARNLPDDAISTLTYPVDLRGRLDKPALSLNFFGNAVHLSCLKVNVGDIKHNHVSYLAKKVRDDKDAACSAEYLRSVVDLLDTEMRMHGKAIGFKTDLLGGIDIQASFFLSYPVNEVDFGFGKLLHFSFYVDPRFGNGVIFFLPTPYGGRSRYMAMSIAEEHMKMVLQNKFFTSILQISQEEPDQLS